MSMRRMNENETHNVKSQAPYGPVGGETKAKTWNFGYFGTEKHGSGPQSTAQDRKIQNTGQDRFRPQNTAQDRSGPLRTSSRPLRIRLRASRPLSSAQQDTLRAHTCV